MVWIVQNQSGRMLNIRDLGIILHNNQTRDLDTMGREAAEKSSDLQKLLANGSLAEIRKDGPQDDAPPLQVIGEEEEPAKEEQAAPPGEEPTHDDQEEEAPPAESIPAETVPGPPGTGEIGDKVATFVRHYRVQARAYLNAFHGIEREVRSLQRVLRAGMDSDEERQRLQFKVRRLEENRSRLLRDMGVEDEDAELAIGCLETMV